MGVNELLAIRAQVSRSLAAWDAARLHVSRAETAKAESRASRTNRATPTGWRKGSLQRPIWVSKRLM
eukprot:7109429-Karenia_brevis.AAC.1